MYIKGSMAWNIASFMLLSMLFIAAMVMVPVILFAETLTWDAPTEYEVPEGAPAGSTPVPLPPDALKEYRLYDKRKLVKAIPAPTVQTTVIISSGKTYAWEVTVIDKAGQQSDYSNAVIWYPTPVPTLQWPPQEPGNLKLGIGK